MSHRREPVLTWNLAALVFLVSVVAPQIFGGYWELHLSFGILPLLPTFVIHRDLRARSKRTRVSAAAMN